LSTFAPAGPRTLSCEHRARLLALVHSPLSLAPHHAPTPCCLLRAALLWKADSICGRKREYCGGQLVSSFATVASGPQPVQRAGLLCSFSPAHFFGPFCLLMNCPLWTVYPLIPALAPSPSRTRYQLSRHPKRTHGEYRSGGNTATFQAKCFHLLGHLGLLALARVLPIALPLPARRLGYARLEPLARAL